jgi:thiamine phosphate synthase YjbQ (UPF0047 family)
MKSFRQELWFNLPVRMEFVNITPQVAACVKKSGVREGLCLVRKKARKKAGEKSGTEEKSGTGSLS